MNPMRHRCAVAGRGTGSAMVGPTMPGPGLEVSGLGRSALAQRGRGRWATRCAGNERAPHPPKVRVPPLPTIRAPWRGVLEPVRLNRRALRGTGPMRADPRRVLEQMFVVQRRLRAGACLAARETRASMVFRVCGDSRRENTSLRPGPSRAGTKRVCYRYAVGGTRGTPTSPFPRVAGSKTCAKWRT